MGPRPQATKTEAEPAALRPLLRGGKEGHGLSPSANTSTGRRLQVGWAQVGDLQPRNNQNEVEYEARFGYSVALASTGALVAIGAPTHDADPSGGGTTDIKRGLVRVLTYDDMQWDVREDITDSAHTGDEDFFGRSVAMSLNGNFVAIGADGANNDDGRVKVYSWDKPLALGVYSQHGSSLDGRSGMGDRFGYNLALSGSGDVLVVAGYPGTTKSTYAQAFKWDTSDWAQRNFIVDGTRVDTLPFEGYPVATSDDGSVLAVGEDFYRDPPGCTTVCIHQGRVRVFGWDSDQGAYTLWVEIPGGTIQEAFGRGIALSGADGHILAVSAPEYLAGAGEVAVYDISNQGTHELKGPAIIGPAGYRIGNTPRSLSLSKYGDTLAISSDVATNFGVVKVYQWQSTTRVYAQVADDIFGKGGGYRFGQDVALSANGRVVASGAPYSAPTNAGRVRVFETTAPEITSTAGHWGRVTSDESHFIPLYVWAKDAEGGTLSYAWTNYDCPNQRGTGSVSTIFSPPSGIFDKDPAPPGVEVASSTELRILPDTPSRQACFVRVKVCDTSAACDTSQPIPISINAPVVIASVTVGGTIFPIPDDGTPPSHTPSLSINPDGTTKVLSVTAVDADNGPLHYRWTSNGDPEVPVEGCPSPNFGNPTMMATTLSFDAGTTPTVCQVEVEVCDGNNACDTTTVEITINAPPTIPATIETPPGPVTIVPGEVDTKVLAVMASEGQAWTYEWRNVDCIDSSGTLVPPTSIFGSPQDASTTVNFDHGTPSQDCQVEVKVCDSPDALACVTVRANVYINTPPAIVVDPSPIPINSGSVERLDATGSSDADGHPLNYLWTVGDCPNNYVGIYLSGGRHTYLSAASNTPAQVCQIQAGACDAYTCVWAPVKVYISTAENKPPKITSVAGSGTITADGEDFNTLSVIATDADGDSLTYEWMNKDCPAGSTIFGTQYKASTTLKIAAGTPPSQACYVQVKVCDLNACDTDTAIITINAPVVISYVTPSAVTVAPGGNAQLFVSATDPDDGQELEPTWTHHTCPASSIIFGTSTLMATTLTIPEGTQGEDCEVQVEVCDSWNACDTATVEITINTPPEVEPLDAAVVFVSGASGAPTDNGVLSVSATDPEGQDLDYTWTTDCPGTLEDRDTDTPKLTVPAGTEPQVCDVVVKVCDVFVACAVAKGIVTIVDPAAGFVTGGGYFMSPAGAYTADPTATGKANFGFVSKYNKGRSEPSGDTTFKFNTVGFAFESTSYDSLVVAGNKANFKGSGRLINGGANDLGFMLTACDNGEGNDDEPVIPDTFRIKIWEKSNDFVVYDNKPETDDDSYDGTDLAGGNIQIHADKKNLRK